MRYPKIFDERNTHDANFMYHKTHLPGANPGLYTHYSNKPIWYSLSTVNLIVADKKILEETLRTIALPRPCKKFAPM